MSNGIFNNISDSVRGDAERQGTVDGGFVPDEKMIFYIGTDAFGNLAGMIQWNFRHDQDFLSAPAAYIPMSADMGPNDMRNFL